MKPGMLIGGIFTLLGLIASTSNAQPGTVVGRAVDSSGQPIAGAIIWVNPVVTTGLYETWTDADGYYQATGLPPVGYRVMGWFEKEYRGQRYCLRLGHPNASDYSPVNPAEGATRDLVWQLQGRIHDIEVYSDMGYFGGSVSVMNEMMSPARNTPLEFTLTPNGPLIDGSTGETLVRRPNAEGYLLDIPVGAYTVTATLNGQPVRVGSTTSNLANQATLEFPGGGTCKGNSSSGVGRAYLYWGEGGASTGYGTDVATDGTSNGTVNPDGTISVDVPYTTSADGMAGTWDGTFTVGGSTFNVRYVFVDTEYGQGFVTIAGAVYECDGIRCLKLGTVSGKRVPGAGVNFTTTIDASGATFETVGHLEGTTFVGLTDAVFDGQEAYVTLNPY